MTAAALALLLLAAPQEGLVVRELGLGFRPRHELPNIPPAPRGTTLPPPHAPPRLRYAGRTDAWMTFQVELENGGRALEGTLVVRAVSFSAPGSVYEKRVSLPARGRKRVAFPVLHSLGQQLSLSFRDDREGGVPLEGSASLAVPPPHSLGLTASLTLVATEHRGALNHLLRRTAQGFYSTEALVVPMDPRHLPTTAVEYEGVNVLVLDDIPIDALSPEQQDAIVQFTARGGLLVAALHRSAAQAAGTRLEPLLPGAPGGVVNVAEVAALAAAAGAPCPLERPQALGCFKPRDGARVWDPETRVALHRRYDRGLVAALGFPLSAPFLERWAGSDRLMESLVAASQAPLVPMPGAVQDIPIRREAAVALKESMLRTLPPFATVLWLMVGYAAAVVLLPWLIGRGLRRLEWSWAGILLLAGAGAGVVYAVGDEHSRKDSSAFRIGLVEGGADGGARLRHNFWSVFTARGERLDLAFEEGSAVPHALGEELSLRGAGGRESLQVGWEGARLRRLRTFTQDSTLFETTDLQRLPGAIAFRRDGDRYRAEAGPGLLLHRAWVVQNGFAAAVERGAAPVPTEPLEKAALPDPFAAGDPRNLLFKKAAALMLRQAAAASRVRDGRPLLVYQYEGSPSLKGAALPEQSIDFGWRELEGDDGPETTRFWRQRRVTPEDAGGAGYDAAFHGAEGVELVLTLPPLPEGWEVRSLDLSHPYSFLSVEAWDFPKGAWVALGSKTNLSPAVSRFVHVSPLRSASARLRVRLAESSRSSVYHVVRPENALQAGSKIERTAP